jgi:hypothetical protein
VKKEIVDPSFNNMNAVEVTVPGTGTSRVR